jgi:DNA repair exonuclease SbcCD ATPase subunit
MEEYHEERAELGRELLTAREELTALRANLKTVTDRMEKLTEERLADANALDDAQREIAEDAKATAESQEITGKYMDDAESAQREIAELKLERQRFENAALDAVTAAQQDQAKIERAEALIRQMLEEWRALAAQRDRTMIGPPDMDLRSYGTGANRAFNETANFAGEQIKAVEKYLEVK